MDTVMDCLPAGVSELLMENFVIVEVVAMFSIGAYNALEVGFCIFNNFTHYRGLYFWSMQVATWGILLHAIPAQLRYMKVAPNMSTSIPFLIGWYAMVTGQAVVLYSRLHLVVTNMSCLRRILWMIIANVLILHVPMTVFFLGVEFGDTRFTRAAYFFDQIQVVGFCLNIFLLVAEFNKHWLEVSFKTVVYSIKLKLELCVLDRLRSLTRTTSCMCNNGPASPRRSSDINVFDMLVVRSRARPDTEAPSHPIDVNFSSRRPSLRSSTYEFHQALRETASIENIISPIHSCCNPASPTEQTSRPRVGSAETASTVEITLVESLK
ncbi:hypothetical protein N7504_005294 [Penicillium tannophilum]|nr:hypothetical protein N7504_005294 [Penicillium tannophilum]